MHSHKPYDDTASVVRATIAQRPDRPSVTALADRLGMPRQRLGSRLAGRTDFRVAELHALAEALEVPVTALLDGPARPTTRGRME